VAGGAPRVYSQARGVPRAGGAVRVAPRGVVVGPHGGVASAGYYHPYYRPYYAFHPHVSIGFGIWAGYPVAWPYYGYGYGYGYPYGYSYPYAAYPYPYGYPAASYGYPASSYPPSNYPQSSYPPSNYPQSGYPPSGYPESGSPTGTTGTVGVQQGGQQGGQQTSSGGVSFEITPGTAAIFVDGTYVGTAANFGPTSQPLGLAPGRHHIEIRASGFQDLAFDADITPGQVIPYQGTLERRN
jgi:hypothetical protein